MKIGRRKLLGWAAAAPVAMQPPKQQANFLGNAGQIGFSSDAFSGSLLQMSDKARWQRVLDNPTIAETRARKSVSEFMVLPARHLLPLRSVSASYADMVARESAIKARAEHEMSMARRIVNRFLGVQEDDE